MRGESAEIILVHWETRRHGENSESFETVRPKLVEACPGRLPCRQSKGAVLLRNVAREERCFNKLSTNGVDVLSAPPRLRVNLFPLCDLCVLCANSSSPLPPHLLTFMSVALDQPTHHRASFRKRTCTYV